MARRGLWNIAKKKNKALKDRRALPREEGDASREYKAIHEESFLGSGSRKIGKVKRRGIRKSEL